MAFQQAANCASWQLAAQVSHESNTLTTARPRPTFKKLERLVCRSTQTALRIIFGDSFPVPPSYRSIALGLDAVPAEVKVVIVHDMVRPFVDAETLGRVTLAAKEHKAGNE